jgi:hypothetical protein
LRDIREVVWKVVCLTLEGRLRPAARRELTNIIQLLQIYLRSAEIELAAGEKPERGSVALPADLLEKVQQFITDQEAQRAKDEARRSEMQALTEELIEMTGWEGEKAASLRHVAKM